MDKHTCHAIGCNKHCAPKMLMCSHHWNMVPDDLQRRVYDTYRKGQEKDKSVTREWFYASQAAIQAVKEMEDYSKGLSER